MLLLPLLIALLGIRSVHTEPPSAARSPHHIASPTIPSIAHIGSIATGSTTMEQLTHRFGSGSYIPGGHPIGGRSWHVSNAGVSVTADGFYYNRSGRRIVDSLTVYAEHDKSLRGGHARNDGFTFMGTIHLEMEKGTVFNLLKDKLPPPRPIKDEFWDAAGQSEIGWHMSGRAELDHFGKYRFTEWDTKLLFDHGKLVEINVSCD